MITGISRYLRRFGRKTLLAGLLAAATIVVVPAYVRAYTLSGTSDVPTLLLGDTVWVNLASYDVRFPFTDRVVFARQGPRAGDLVLVESPDNGRPIFKRVVALPGDRVEMNDFHLTINDRRLAYVPRDIAAFANVPAENELGSRVELETLGACEHLISYSPGPTSRGSFPEVTVPPGSYFLLGDNRGISRDSRDWGPVPRGRIRGRVFTHPTGQGREATAKDVH
jgi:signal peptidase I